MPVAAVIGKRSINLDLASQEHDGLPFQFVHVGEDTSACPLKSTVPEGCPITLSRQVNHEQRYLPYKIRAILSIPAMHNTYKFESFGPVIVSYLPGFLFLTLGRCSNCLYFSTYSLTARSQNIPDSSSSYLASTGGIEFGNSYLLIPAPIYMREGY